MLNSPDRQDAAAPVTVGEGLTAADGANAASRVWDRVSRMIADAVAPLLRRPPVDVNSVNYPLASAAGVADGTLLFSVIVGFPSRVLGWSLESVHGGTITLDVRRSTPASHPTMVSLCSSSYYPTMTGFYVPFTDAVLWPGTELAVGEMLHIYCMHVGAGWVDGSLELRLRRLDVPPP